MTDRFVAVCPGARVETAALHAALRASGRPGAEEGPRRSGPHRVISDAEARDRQQRTGDHRAAVALLLDHGALVEPFLTGAVRVSVQRGTGVSADIDWPAANEVLRELAEPVVSSRPATVWREAFTIASRGWTWVPLRSSGRPAAPPGAEPVAVTEPAAATEPARGTGDGEYLAIAQGAWATREAIHDALRRWANRLVETPIYALEADRFLRLFEDQRDAIEQLIEEDAIRGEFLDRAVIPSISYGAVNAYVSWHTARGLLPGMATDPTMIAWRNACWVTGRLT